MIQLGLFTLVPFLFGGFSLPVLRQYFAKNKMENTEKRVYPVLTVGDHSTAVMTLHEMLAELGYLPVEFHAFSPAERFERTYDTPCAGTWTWRFSNTPNELREIWDETTYTEITKGAVMTFQKEHHLQIDGFAGPQVFRMLEVAESANIFSAKPYTHVIVKQSIPQTLTVWQEGKAVFKSLCSTGVEKAATHYGTHVIYLRNIKQGMEGITPWGEHYAVKDVPYVSFFYKGEAIHGLQRAAYGMPQSVGCVELPIESAKMVWKLTDYGTLVTVKQ